MNYDLELKQKMKEIEDRILSKTKIRRINLDDIGKQPRRGRIKDLRAEKLCETFGMSRECLKIWRNGSRGVGRQRLYAFLYSLDIEVYKELQDIIKERIV